MTEKKCDLPAIFRYTWPGKDEKFACFHHAVGISNVAIAMGFNVQMILIDQSTTQEVCSTIVKEEVKNEEV